MAAGIQSVKESREGMMEMAERSFGPSYYAIITGPVLDNRKLAANAKLLYASITTMTDQKGYCWAGNQYLAERFGWGERTVSRLVAQLEGLGFIRTSMIFNKESGKMERRIYIGNEAADGVAKIGEGRQNWRGDVAKNGETILNKNEKEKEKREKKFSPPADLWERCKKFAGGDCDLEAALYGFLENRNANKNPIVTGRALSILLNKLQRISDGSRAVMIAMLDKAVLNNWDGVFALKPDEMPKEQKSSNNSGGGYGWQ